ncbi:MAG: FAD-dependent oxidoreductase [Bacteroidetes bacterium]|uniref:ferredoxin--NADP reductase n=1 Tax=Phnomibacter sp. TaxID=2836217 RepID=UPI002FDDAD31|nr:FAD-dependent oxidoreductase [Bacteroidota bacterium]
MALLEWQTGVITRIIDETHNTKRYFFELPEQTDFVFEPGQFVTLDLPIHEQKNKRWRSYSIASAPNGSNTFELIIVLNHAGAGTTWLWQHAEVGTSLPLRGPQGKFTMPADLSEDLYLICTGTGIAPFRSMVQYIHQHQKAHQNIYLLFGCRKFNDTLYGTELRQLQDDMPGFTFIPTYSRELPDNALLQRTGYVHQVYEELIKQRTILHQQNGGTGLSPAKFMLCGWKSMIDEARQRLAAIGYDKKDIHFELYG